MKPRLPVRTGDKYVWTRHVRGKMYHYGITPNRVKRVIRAPERVEEGIAENTVAAMQTAGTKHKTELWTMYRPTEGKILVITAWRYPGKSPERNPVPREILEEIRDLL